MWQRIQTVWLLLAVAALAVFVSLPLGYFVPENMAANATLYSLWLETGTGEKVFTSFILHLLPLVVMFISLYAIVAFKNRKKQAKLCATGCLFLVLEYVALTYFVYFQYSPMGEFSPSFMVCLPVVSAVFILLARRAILKDEALVRAADRIR